MSRRGVRSRLGSVVGGIFAWALIVAAVTIGFLVVAHAVGGSSAQNFPTTTTSSTVATASNTGNTGGQCIDVFGIKC
jgi:hypothetical protein